MIAITYDRVYRAIASVSKELEKKVGDIDIEVNELMANKNFTINKKITNNDGKQKSITETKQLSDADINYLEQINDKGAEAILCATPKQIKAWSTGDLNPEGLSTDFKKYLKESVLIYTRSDKYIFKYFRSLGIKACVYCNALSAFDPYIDDVNVYKNAGFECDHFLNKDDHPTFSISFFNLYPSCGNCNRAKGKLSVDFNLYVEKEEDIKKHRFLFALDAASRARYLLDKKPESLTVKFTDFEEKQVQGKEKTFADRFNIRGIYAQHRDMAEELILKQQVYTDTYLKSLNQAFGKIVGGRERLRERLIIGNYSRPEEIHKRPLSKFSQDIARQLGLLQPPEQEK